MLALLSPDVQTFLVAHPCLGPVLDAMVAPLRGCFGPHRTTLEVLHDGEEGPLLRLRVHLPPGTDAGAALARFDAAWWVEHCHRTAGLLVIDTGEDAAS